MTDWREAGYKADAHRVRDLFRSAFDGGSKAIARRRAIEVLTAAGGETVLDLWGGGMSAKAMTDAGLRVISVDNGSLELVDRGHPVTSMRKRRALERSAAEDGYEARWGKVPAFAAEADVAFLDFCGPWSGEVRRAVEACRHMKAVVVTLMTDHDISSSATTQQERMEAYKAFLRVAFAGPRIADQRSTPCRLLCRYRRSTGQPVWVFLVASGRVPIRHLSSTERSVMDPSVKARTAERHRSRWASDIDFRARQMASHAAYRIRMRDDPEYRNRQRAANRASYAKRKARLAAAADPVTHD